MSNFSIVKMVKNRIKVCARIKGGKHAGCKVKYLIQKQDDHEMLSIQLPNTSGTYSSKNRTTCFNFRFSNVFDKDSEQDEIFQSVAQSVINSFLNGFNATIFAYGQTGSGKTYTITGSPERYERRGLIPRSIEHVFSFTSKSSNRCSVCISYMEIYNEVCYDLLDSKHHCYSFEQLPRVCILEDSKGELHMRNLSIHSVSSEKEAMRLLFLGDTNRTIAETPANEISSRSHCIFTIYFSYWIGNTGNVRRSKLNLVDLAGSERIHKTNMSGVTLTEAKSINLSLYYLQQVILALTEAKRSHVPYRNSVMTNILKDSLGGNCFTLMLATVSMNYYNLDETVSTCKFSQRVAMVSTDAYINEDLDPYQQIQNLSKEIDTLRSHLRLNTSEKDVKTNVFDAPLTEDEITKCKKLVDLYINNSNTDFPSIEPNINMYNYSLHLLKDEILKLKSENEKKYACSTTYNYDEIIQRKDEEIAKLNILLNNALQSDDSRAKDQMFGGKNTNNIENCEECSNIKINRKSKDELRVLKMQDDLYKKYDIAKSLVPLIEQCQRNIIMIRKKLGSNNVSSECYTNLLEELNQQQSIYRESLAQLQNFKAEIEHLEHGLQQAELMMGNNLKKWASETSPRISIAEQRRINETLIPSGSMLQGVGKESMRNARIIPSQQERVVKKQTCSPNRACNKEDFCKIGNRGISKNTNEQHKSTENMNDGKESVNTELIKRLEKLSKNLNHNNKPVPIVMSLDDPDNKGTYQKTISSKFSKKINETVKRPLPTSSNQLPIETVESYSIESNTESQNLEKSDIQKVSKESIIFDKDCTKYKNNAPSKYETDAVVEQGGMVKSPRNSFDDQANPNHVYEPIFDQDGNEMGSKVNIRIATAKYTRKTNLVVKAPKTTESSFITYPFMENENIRTQEEEILEKPSIKQVVSKTKFVKVPSQILEENAEDINECEQVNVIPQTDSNSVEECEEYVETPMRDSKKFWPNAENYDDIDRNLHVLSPNAEYDKDENLCGEYKPIQSELPEPEANRSDFCGQLEVENQKDSFGSIPTTHGPLQNSNCYQEYTETNDVGIQAVGSSCIFENRNHVTNLVPPKDLEKTCSPAACSNENLTGCKIITTTKYTKRNSTQIQRPSTSKSPKSSSSSQSSNPKGNTKDSDGKNTNKYNKKGEKSPPNREETHYQLHYIPQHTFSKNTVSCTNILTNFQENSKNNPEKTMSLIQEKNPYFNFQTKFDPKKNIRKTIINQKIICNKQQRNEQNSSSSSSEPQKNASVSSDTQSQLYEVPKLIQSLAESLFRGRNKMKANDLSMTVNDKRKSKYEDEISTSSLQTEENNLYEHEQNVEEYQNYEQITERNTNSNDKNKENHQSSASGTSKENTLSQPESYFKEGDSQQFKDFIKTVPLTGDRDVDEEIVNFYRTKFK